MKKIYMHEKDIPKSCSECFAVNYESLICEATGRSLDEGYDYFYSCDEKHPDCPLKSIEAHDREYKKKVLADLVTAIKEQD